MKKSMIKNGYMEKRWSRLIYLQEVKTAVITKRRVNSHHDNLIKRNCSKVKLRESCRLDELLDILRLLFKDAFIPLQG